jgi:3-oxoacyl-[acyl-carrier protein] reductase
MLIGLHEKVALVTGGARGIGRAISLALAAAGATVVVNYRGNQAAADDVVQTIVGQGGRAIAVQADVGTAEDVERLFKSVADSYGRLDILVNNAGITRDGLLLRMKEADFDAVLDTNLRGAFLCTKAALRPMTKARAGRIINITSVVGLMGNAGQANYSAAKAGLIGFTKAVAREMASRAITVNALAPGYIDTEMTAGLGEQVRAAILENIPLGRLGTPEDIAGVVCFLASDAAGYITGQTITVDGGMVMA